MIVVPARIDAPLDRWIDRGTRIVRLLAWIMAFACAVLLFAILAESARAEDPKAAARAIGQAGAAAAGAIARSAGSAATVPGYAGTDVPERRLTASGMEDAARTRLTDPDDPGGAAGRAVIEGTVNRPDADVPASDPAVMRSERIAASPQSGAHGADGLASGSVSDCGAGLEDAQAGGSCGSVRWCVGAGCDSVSGQANTGFVNATTRLNMGSGARRRGVRPATTCASSPASARPAPSGCSGSPIAAGIRALLVGLANCSARGEVELAEERNAGNTHYLGRYCARRTFFGVCIRRARAWCVFGSKLGRILQEQGRSQLGVGWGDCRGLTVAEVEGIDFERLDLSEFTDNLLDGGTEPAISLPEAGDTQGVMRERVRDFYRRGE